MSYGGLKIGSGVEMVGWGYGGFEGEDWDKDGRGLKDCEGLR